MKLLGFSIIVNLRDWGLSRGLHDMEIGPVLLDWEDVGLFEAISTWLTKWHKSQHPYWVQQKVGGLTRLVAFLKWSNHFFVTSRINLFVSDILTIRHLSTGVRYVRSGGVWTSSVSDDIIFGDGHQTRAWASLPEIGVLARLAYRLYPQQCAYCLYWMGQQARRHAAYCPPEFIQVYNKEPK